MAVMNAIDKDETANHWTCWMECNWYLHYLWSFHWSS